MVAGSFAASLFDLTGKTALVTGGAQGLGRMIAEGLLSAGATVAITSRKADVCEAAAAEMSALGRCIALPADLSTPEAAVELVERYRAQVGPCHIVVNNAGKTWGGEIDTFPDKAWPGVMAVNVQTPFTMVRELLPELTAAGTPDDPARVINIGSVAGVKTERLKAYSYAASKAAVHMMTRDLAGDLAERNITVNAVIPGFFPTKMTAHMRDEDSVDPALLAHIPLRRLGNPGDIAAVIVFLCGKGGSYVTGAQIPVDGGVVGCG
ncbi:3-oxoacyl-ACP reductase [Novosphingobium lubricantis]